MIKGKLKQDILFYIDPTSQNENQHRILYKAGEVIEYNEKYEWRLSPYVDRNIEVKKETKKVVKKTTTPKTTKAASKK